MGSSALAVLLLLLWPLFFSARFALVAVLVVPLLLTFLGLVGTLSNVALFAFVALALLEGVCVDTAAVVGAASVTTAIVGVTCGAVLVCGAVAALTLATGA